jgi:hypothetical protein
MKADRYNEGKCKWSLVDFKSLEPMVKVLEYGTEKYSRDNWKKGLPVTEICESLMRHLYAFLDGENIDPESGMSHIGHIQCNAMFLAHMIDKEGFDDRSGSDYDIDKQQLTIFDVVDEMKAEKCPHGLGADCVACERQGK